ncbi:hypothetical protein NEAUS07_2267 [Nematocida ausubeli]|nr:hypothetical protein NEAUS07_2267 [Nematocida ausubeli]
MNKKKWCGVRYMLLCISIIICLTEIKLYLRTVKISVLCAQQSSTLKRKKEEEISFASDSVQKKNTLHSLCCCSGDKTKDAKVSTESATLNNKKTAVPKDTTVRKKLVRKKEKLSDASLENVPESKNNSSSSSCATKTVPVPDKNTSPSPAAKKRASCIENKSTAADTAKKETNGKKKMYSTANSYLEVSVKKRNEIADIRVKYNMYMNACGFVLDKINAIIHEINHCHTMYDTCEIPNSINAEYDSEIEKIKLLRADIDGLKNDRRNKWNAYMAGCHFVDKLEKNIYNLRKSYVQYYSEIVRSEKRLIIVIEHTIKLLQKICDKEELQSSIKEKEAAHFKEDKQKAAALSKIAELHRIRLEYTTKLIDLENKKHTTQENIILREIERRDAYVAYDESASADENKKINQQKRAKEKALQKKSQKDTSKGSSEKSTGL